MCHFCETQQLDDSRTQLEAHGFTLIQPGAAVQFGVTWDGRPVATTEQRERAVKLAAEQGSNQPGRWEAKQRAVGPWVDLEPVKKG